MLPHPYLREGQRVRITDGALTGLEGILVRSRPQRGLLVLTVELLRRSVAVEVDCAAVVPVGNAGIAVAAARMTMTAVAMQSGWPVPFRRCCLRHAARCVRAQGSMDVRPSAAVTEVYDSNLFATTTAHGRISLRVSRRPSIPSIATPRFKSLAAIRSTRSDTLDHEEFSSCTRVSTGSSTSDTR